MSLIENWQSSDLLKDGDPDVYERVTTLQLKKEALTALAKALDGLTANTPDDYQEHVASPDTGKAMRRDMLGMSGCALTALGLWRRLGVGDALLWDAYKIGHAVADVVSVGKAHKVWTNAPKKDTQPFSLGDVVIVSNTPGTEHVFTVVTEPRITEYRNGTDGNVVEKIAFNALHGGRKGRDGKQRIEITETVCRWNGSNLVVTGKSQSGVTAAPKIVRGFARTVHMALEREALLPEGWTDVKAPA